MVRFAGLLLVGLSLIARWDTTAAAALITWGAAQTISGDGVVSTVGSLAYAYNLANSAVQSTTVNGVSFGAFALPAPFGSTQTVTVGSVTFTESPGTLWGINDLGTASAPYSNLSGAYQTLLGSGGGSEQSATITTTLGGLTIGQQYQLQWWTNDASRTNSSSFTFGSTQAGRGILGAIWQA